MRHSIVDVKTMDSFASGFAGVDKAGDANSFVQYLDLVHSLPFFQECKRLSYQKLGIVPGASVLEIGCGNGIDALNLAGMAGPDGHVIGIDVSSTMLASARARGETSRGSVDFALCATRFLAFADGSFDAVRTDRVIQHTRDPFSVVREMARVTRPSGNVVAFEPDLETFVIWPGERCLTRKALNFWCDRIPSGWVGRSLYPAFARAGLQEIEVRPVNLVITDLALAGKIFDLETEVTRAVQDGIIDAGEAEALVRERVRADAAGEFFSSLTFYLVSGKKPRE